VALVDGELLSESVDQVVVLGILDDLQDGRDQSIDFGARTTNDHDVLRGRRVLAADSDGSELVFTQKSSKDATSRSDNVPVPFLHASRCSISWTASGLCAGRLTWSMSIVSVLTSAASLAKSVMAEAALVSDSASLASFCFLSLGKLASSPSKTSKTAEDSSEAGGKTARTL